MTKWGLAYHLSTAACSSFLRVKSSLFCNEVKKNTLKWQIDDRTDRAFVSRLAESNQARIRRPRVIDRSDRMVPSSRFFSFSVTSRSFYYGFLFPFVIGILPVIHWPEICKVQGRTDGSWTDKRLKKYTALFIGCSNYNHVHCCFFLSDNLKWFVNIKLILSTVLISMLLFFIRDFAMRC